VPPSGCVAAQVSAFERRSASATPNKDVGGEVRRGPRCGSRERSAGLGASVSRSASSTRSPAPQPASSTAPVGHHSATAGTTAKARQLPASSLEWPSARDEEEDEEAPSGPVVLGMSPIKRTSPPTAPASQRNPPAQGPTPAAAAPVVQSRPAHPPEQPAQRAPPAARQRRASLPQVSVSDIIRQFQVAQ